jgi:hypothetical protein
MVCLGNIRINTLQKGAKDDDDDDDDDTNQNKNKNKVELKKYESLIAGNSITRSIHCNHRTAAPLYTLDYWFFQVYKCKYSVLKLINNNNNNNNRMY